MGDVIATPTEDGQVLVTFTEDVRVDDDVYVLSIELAEKLRSEIEAILDAAKFLGGPHSSNLADKTRAQPTI